MNKIAFATAALALTLAAAGCEQATIGSSATLDTDHPQTLVGRFDNHTTAFVIDLDRDGLSDVLLFNFESQEVRYDADPLAEPRVTFFGERPRLHVYYGRAGGLGRERSTASADAVLVVGDGEMLEALGAADVDGDGLDELLVYTVGAAHHPFGAGLIADPVGAAVYVLDGGVRYADEVSLPETGRRVATPRRTREWYEPRAALADLDGAPGLELAYVEDQHPDPFQEAPRDIMIRDIEDGTLIAALTPREGESLWVVSVMDLDADGVSDVICDYMLHDANDALVEQGIAVFYGPIDTDRRLGDPGTEQLAGASLQFGGPFVPGNFIGDAAVDALWLESDRLFVLRGGPRTDFPELSDRWEALDTTDALLANDPFTDRWVAFAPDQDEDGFDEIVARNGDQLRIFAPSGQVHDTIVLPTSRESVLNVWFGGMGDTDGDGRADLVLGSSHNWGGRSSGYIISGVGE
ncbi:MAG: hypothetical protein KC621_28140 [Myxococcales bacterium]|nr:hypothetical protein [Myxococcales bacterium]